MGEERSVFLCLMIINYTFEGLFHLMADLGQVSGNKLLVGINLLRGSIFHTTLEYKLSDVGDYNYFITLIV